MTFSQRRGTMEVTALCTRLIVRALLLLLATQVQDRFAQRAYAALPRVAPARLQHFEYEYATFNCEGFDGSLGRGLMRKTTSKKSACGSDWGILDGSVCTIRGVYVDDSGEYWCETRNGGKSETVNITVTAGSVILETPVFSVMEGKAVTLHCMNKTSSTTSASFYKNGILIRNSPTGHMTVFNICKSDEGLYKCKISGAGESPESRLTVTGNHDKTLALCSDQLPVLLYLLIRTIATVCWVALLLLVMRKRDSRKDKAHHVEGHLNAYDASGGERRPAKGAQTKKP